MAIRSPKGRVDRTLARKVRLIGEETQFWRNLLEHPRLTGAVAPSGPFLARAMAKAVGQPRPGLIVELGPGTGPVTKALIEQGVARDRLVLVEYDPGFCRMLAARFAPARVVQGDAYNLPETLAPFAGQKIAAIVSSLPLLNQPAALRTKLIDDAFALMGPAGVFVQFTYGLDSPVPRQACVQKYSALATAPIWRNLPPARVWCYRYDPKAIVAKPIFGKLREQAGKLGRRINEKRLEAEHMLRRQRARVRVMLTKNAKGALDAGRARQRRRAQRRDTPTDFFP